VQRSSPVLVPTKAKVENWLEKSVVEPGKSHDCYNKAMVGDGEQHRHVGGNDSDKPPTDAAGVSTHRAIQELTSAIKNADLPLYFGDPMEWLQFREAFYESTRICNYSDSENVWRLRKCLRGDAKEAASALLMGTTSPKEVMDTLELRFGRPENVMRQVYMQLRKLSPLPDAYHAEIVKFAIKIKNYVTAVTTMKQSDYLRSPQLTSIVVSKLPSNLLSKWIDYLNERSQEDTPKLQLLSQFLYVEAEKVAASGVTVAVNDPDVKCKFCRRNEHSLPECSKFKRALRRDRWRFVRGNQLCYKCLCARHPDPAACTAGSCIETDWLRTAQSDCDVEACGGPHHRLLHWTKPEAARQEPSAPPGDASKPESELVAHANVTRAAECSEVSVLNVPNATQTLSATKVVLKIVPVTVHGPKTSVNTHALLDDGATVTLISADLADKVGLHGKTVTMRASGAWDSELVCQTELIKCAISNSNGDKYELRARKLKELNLPVQFVSSVECSEHVPNINYSLYSNIKVKPKLLIGQDNYDLIAPLVCKKYKTSGPFITQTLLGWCVHGALRQTDFTDKRAEHANSASSVSGRGAAPPERPLALTQLGKPTAHARRASAASASCGSGDDTGASDSSFNNNIIACT
ncbi:hypothetical protein SFRURICE_019300, partial [Spodoptera frugiperda]